RGQEQHLSRSTENPRTTGTTGERGEMKHLTQEQIVLHCYGDASDGEGINQHLQECSQCRAEFSKVKAMLAEIPPTVVPEPPAYLEQKLWLNLRDKLQAEKPSRWHGLFARSRWMLGGAVAALVVAAFLAGRFWPNKPPEQRADNSAKVNPQRVVLVAGGGALPGPSMRCVAI